MKSMAIVAAAAWTASVSAQNLVVNGGFEQSNYPDDCCGSCGTAIVVPGWQASNVDQIRAPEFAIAGEWGVDLNQCSPGSIRQVIPTVPGQPLRLRFALGSPKVPNCGQGPVVTTLRFGEFAQVIAIDLGSGFDWYSFDVTPTAASTTLIFEGTSGGCAGGVLDEVSLISQVCVSDVDSSGAVDAVDLAMVLQTWGVSNTLYPRADINADGFVNSLDVQLLLANWGACP